MAVGARREETVRRAGHAAVRVLALYPATDIRVHPARCPCPGCRRPPLAVRLSLLLSLLMPVNACFAGGGLLGLDHELAYDDSGIWKRSYQEDLEYGPDHPLTYALEALTVYDGIARMKVQAHWQSDVIAGSALGTGTGWLMHRNPNSPFILRVMPHGIYVGIGTHF